MVRQWGWHSAYVCLAILFLVVVLPPVFWLIPANPDQAESGVVEGHRSTRGKHGPLNGDREWTVKQALTNSSFWLLFTARVLASLGNQVIVTHQVSHAVDVGYPKIFAASIFGVMGVVSIAGRILFGYLS